MSDDAITRFKNRVENFTLELVKTRKRFDAQIEAELNALVIAYSDKALKADNWQPIRTAPKDRDILLLVDIAIGRPLIVQCCWYSVDADDKGWIDANGDVFLATHWMPLPAPPRDS